MVIKATDNVDLDANGGGLAGEKLWFDFEEIIVRCGVLAVDTVSLGLVVLVVQNAG